MSFDTSSTTSIALEVHRFAEKVDFEQLASMRNNCYYESADDKRYLDGGVHERLTSTELRDRFISEKDGFVVTGTDELQELVAYARVSIREDTAHVHLVIAADRIRGEVSLWSFKGRRFTMSPTNALYIGIVDEARLRGLNRLTCRIAVWPIPNIASLVAHRRLGFTPQEHDAFATEIIDNSRSVGWLQLSRSCHEPVNASLPAT